MQSLKFRCIICIQTSLYEYFLENRPNQDQKGKSLIPDYTVLRKVINIFKLFEKANFHESMYLTKNLIVFIDLDTSKSIGKCVFECNPK